jgi:molecular chaperone DnaK (HSP70)
MGDKIVIDFGTSNTVVARFNQAINEPEILRFDNISKYYTYPVSSATLVKTHFIPSLIYFNGDSPMIGNEVLNKGLSNHRHTFKWMKRYIANHQLITKRINSKPISYFDAGEAFLSKLINICQAEYDKIDEFIFTLPVEAYEDYQEWISNICIKNNISQYRVIDEPSACALGYSEDITPNDIFLIFDFGGGTLEVSIVKITFEKGASQKSVVLGKAGEDIGGIDIDKWIFLDLLHKNNLTIDEVKLIDTLIMEEVENLKISLSFEQEKEVSVFDDVHGRLISNRYTRIELENILEEKKLYFNIQKIIDTALDDALNKGIRKQDIKEVLMIGGSSLIPSVRRAVGQNFAKEQIKSFSPFDACAKGACYFAIGAKIFDFIQHSYGLKHLDEEKGEYAYEVLIPKGTPYPTKEEFVSMFIDGAYEGQEELELLIYELGKEKSLDRDKEIVFDTAGHIRFEAPVKHTHLWLNERNPTFIRLNPPAESGTQRLKVSFKVDANKRLCVTVFDLKTNKFLYENQPVVKLH